MRPTLQRRREAWPLGRVLAALYAAGATVFVVWLVLPPHPAEALGGVIVGLSATAYVVAGLAWWRPARVSLAVARVSVFFGQLLISLAVLASAVPWTPYALVYIWAVLFSYHYLGRRAALEQVLFAIVCYAAALVAMAAWLRPESPETAVGPFAVTALTLVVTAFLAGWLRDARDAEWRLRLGSEERFRVLVDQVTDLAIVMLDPVGRVTTWNAGAEAAKGYRSEEIIGRSFAVFFPPEDVAAGTPARLLEEAGRTGRVVTEGIRVRRDGSTYLAHVTVTALRDPAGKLRGFAKVLRDVSELRRTQNLLEHRALHDALTGLPNRTLLLDRIRHALDRAARGDVLPALLFVDLDRFKPINDTLGHHVGDTLLREVGRRLVDAVRPADTVARLGGDEFGILLDTSHTREDAVAVADRVRLAVGQPVTLPGHTAYVGASVGIAFAADASGEPEALLRDADAAMYAAKAEGGDRVRIYSGDMTAAVGARVRTEAGLRQALADDDLFVVYQPIFGVASGEVIGVEALLRWRTPDGRLVSPAEFIPVAEATRLILPIGRRVIQQACRDAARWDAARPSDGGLLMSINLSAIQFADDGLLGEIQDAVRASGLEPRRYQLEITESVLMRDADSSLHTLEALQRVGARLAIDDFGTGYSSLAYLRRFAVDTVKIDRVFVEGLGRRSDDTAVVEAVISLARSLGLMTVAEGVESEEQLALLRALGCDAAQGFLLGRPMSADDVDRLLERPVARTS